MVKMRRLAFKHCCIKIWTHFGSDTFLLLHLVQIIYYLVDIYAANDQSNSPDLVTNSVTTCLSFKISVPSGWSQHKQTCSHLVCPTWNWIVLDLSLAMIGQSSFQIRIYVPNSNLSFKFAFQFQIQISLVMDSLVIGLKWDCD